MIIDIVRAGYGPCVPTSRYGKESVIAQQSFGPLLSFAENSRPMTMNAEVYKTFDRSTPAGRALWALYNASDKSAAKVGNGYSAKNGAAVAAQRQVGGP